jgi:hypothetical protein
MKPPLVIVHPSWPWESRADMPRNTREASLEQCGMILARIADEVEEGGKVFVVGPWVNRASYLPQWVEEDLARIRAGAIALKGGTGDADYNDTAAEISRQIPKGSRVRMAGFWGNICVAKMDQALVKHGHDTRINQAWTMAAEFFPETAKATKKSDLPSVPSLGKIPLTGGSEEGSKRLSR